MSKYDVTKDRYKHIGGSDLAIIMGLSPFKTRWQLLLEKAQIVEPEEVDNEYTRDGHRNEELIRNYYNDNIFKNDPLEETQTFSEDNVYRYNADGQNSELVWECKRVGKITYNSINDPRDKECKKYLVQLLKGMEINKKEKGLLTISLRDGEFYDNPELKEFYININDYQDYLKEIDECVTMFLEDLNKLRNNPDLQESDFVPAEIVNYANEIQVIEDKLKAYKQLEKEQEELKTKLYESMLEAGIKTWTTPNNIKITLVEEIPSTTIIEEKFDEETFKKENEEEYNKYIKQVEKKKSGKKGFIRISIGKGDK
jgi:predicted phage-related endonuclease